MNESNANRLARELGMHGQPDPARDQDVDDDDDDDEDEDEDEEEEGHDVDSTKPPGEKSLKEESEPEYTITIEFDEFLTRFDLDDVLSAIDRIIEDELAARFDPDLDFWLARRKRFYPLWPWPFGSGEAPEFSYVGITAVGAGSVILTFLVSGAVATYVARRFKKGVDKSLLAEEIERSGRLAGDVFGALLVKVNNWAERYVPKQRELGGKITRIRVQRKRKE